MRDSLFGAGLAFASGRFIFTLCEHAHVKFARTLKSRLTGLSQARPDSLFFIPCRGKHRAVVVNSTITSQCGQGRRGPTAIDCMGPSASVQLLTARIVESLNWPWHTVHELHLSALVKEASRIPVVVGRTGRLGLHMALPRSILEFA